MASVKEYAYYMEGSKIALVEKEAAFDNDANSRDYGPGTDRFRWKSPLADVTGGLELLYTYSPIYRIFQAQDWDLNKFAVNGWTVIDGYLAFVRSDGNTTETDWSSTSVVTGSSGEYAGASSARDYIVVSGSSRWNGLHRVKNAGTNGILTTYTRTKGIYPYWENQGVDFAADESFYDRAGGDAVFYGSYFNAGDYVHITGSHVKNCGIFRVSSVDPEEATANSKVYVDNKYHILKANSTLAEENGIGSEYELAATFIAETDQTDIGIYKICKEYCTISSNISVLDDETDEIDIPEYLSKAVIDHVKAQYLEDAGQFKEAEYFMVKFRERIEKYRNRLMPGPRIVAPGSYGIR
mgnify:CR=1 FL=1|tara:strand:- start:36112 stop:37170 length:1059 start_codon:yes stop_codon:yes gene_type:complete